MPYKVQDPIEAYIRCALVLYELQSGQFCSLSRVPSLIRCRAAGMMSEAGRIWLAKITETGGNY